jgi:FecR protein
MKNSKRSHILNLSVFLITSLFFSFAQAQAVHGVFRVVKGDVKIIKSADKSEAAAKIGMKVLPSDTIVAGKDSRAKIIMIDNNEINVSPDSKIQIQSYEYKPKEDKKTVLLNVVYGKVRAKVNQKYEGENTFQVKTPSAVAGVRGTDFMTSYDKGSRETRIVTFEGKVAFGKPGAGGQIVNPVYVAMGQTSSANAGAAPAQPIEVPKTELSQMDQGSDAAKTPEAPSAPTGGANPENKSTTSERAPASVETSGSMLMAGDLPSDTNPTVVAEPPVKAPAVGPAIKPPPPPPPTDFIKDVVSSGSKKIKLTIGTAGP